MFKSFRSQLIAMLVFFLAMIQLISGTAILDTIKRDSLEQAVKRIDVTKKVFQLTLDNRSKNLSVGVSLLASDFGFKTAVATKDGATIRSSLENNALRVGADFGILLSPNGESLQSTYEMVHSSDFTHLLQNKSRRRNINGFIEVDQKAYQLVLVPVRSPNLVAWVGMAFQMGSDLAQEIKGITGLDISFSSIKQQAANEQSVGNYATTLESMNLGPILDNFIKQGVNADLTLFSDDERYLTSAVQLDLDNHWALLHLPYNSWIQNINEVTNRLIIIFSIILTLSIILSWISAKRLLKPIQTLVSKAKKIGRGEQVEIEAQAGEFGVLSRTLSGMQKRISKREEELSFQASHDNLTGLKNRNAVENFLSLNLKAKEGGVLLINIRHFKDINNMMGFENGDILLCEFAQRISKLITNQDEVARLAGDEFLIVFKSQFNEITLANIHQSLQGEFDISGSKVCLQVCMGALFFANQDDMTVNGIMRRVDISADEAKQSENGIAIYEQGQDESHRRTLSIIRDLPESLASHQLFIVYQPKVNIQDRRCHAAEALIRWIHPSLGFISPAEFIPLLERSGNIQLVTKWVIEEVCKQQSNWLREDMQIQVAINLSALDLIDLSLPTFIKSMLEKYAINASQLAFEVTESSVMEDTKTVIHVLNALKKMGFKLSIDDFGTGQSSLAYLRDLPVDEVKIDRSFVHDIDTNESNALIVNTTIQLSHSFGFSVTAEGMENIGGLSILEDYGCETIQGYYFSKPLKSDEFLNWQSSFSYSSDEWWVEKSMEK
ncbi:Signaling protein with a sensor domain, HAMP, GGDEF and EAL domains [Marinomonas sp. MED121]|uniref:bifunctional diguanylate cyclase/phosphodiesterase n=1 Tax=Marinomonas sp. MED121 TaxID=314277 RepID=UPI000068FA2B|nr:EAL domain-containing protein [Marinomonas sp. MED121]EAQ64113.1 Signaling protein with a sensor domain, HAMP, GGDEF and EAL domains [Marinomonas sp. MED121]